MEEHSRGAPESGRSVGDVVRRRMSAERSGTTHKFRVGDAGDDTVKGYVTANFFDDGTVGEIFVKMSKQGSKTSGFIDAWAIAVSMLLQTGTPLTEVIFKFKGMRFQPSGFTGHPVIRMAQSPIDYIVRWLEWRFLHDEAVE